jgi:hypothetical protein
MGEGSSMGIRFKIFSTLLLVIGFNISCTQDAKDRSPGQARVRLPWYTSEGYQLKTITLSTVEDMVYLRGKAAQFILSPMVVNGNLTGMAPRIHTMRTSDGTYIPEDFLSVEALNLYAHFEKLQEFDLQYGLDKLIPGWPRQQTIAINAQVESKDGTMIHDNAMYIGQYEAFIFPEYSLPMLPLALNQAVVAHEYFHSIFYALHLKQFDSIIEKAKADSTPERDHYHKYLMKSLNEGLADVWGWLYSGDYKFVSRSVPGFDRRNLDNNYYAIKLVDTEILAIALNAGLKDNPRDDGFYYIGSTYAKKIFSAAQKTLAGKKISDSELRVKLAAAITNMLYKLNPEISKLKMDQQLDPLVPLKLIQDQVPEIKIEY